MSDYVHNKQVLYPITKELLDKMGITDSSEIEEKLYPADNLDMEYFVDYSGTGESNEYLAYELYSDYGEESGDFGRSRFLIEKEQEKYKKIFSKAIPEEFIDPSLFKYVDYCWYNGVQCDDYYVRKDSFEEEI